MTTASAGAHPVRDAFSTPCEELAHRVRSYNNIRAKQRIGRALPAVRHHGGFSRERSADAEAASVAMRASGIGR
jgi:hypothetical protein